MIETATSIVELIEIAKAKLPLEIVLGFQTDECRPLELSVTEVNRGKVCRYWLHHKKKISLKKPRLTYLREGDRYLLQHGEGHSILVEEILPLPERKWPTPTEVLRAIHG